MEKQVLEKLVESKLSTRAIARKQNCSQSKVKYWLKKYGLKTFVPKRLTDSEKRAKNVKRVTERRKNLKVKALEYKGGKCIKCNYSKSKSALEFHHRDPSKKDYNLSHKGYTRSWDKVKLELDKCDLLCANCHREVHDEL